ncbi:MAG TPA: glycosyltransferase family 39 protein [Thermoanaerobaculia bacterium]|nr:glycosyltransferase family 39 protein [Thermoanaerobaculia bacterium]
MKRLFLLLAATLAAKTAVLAQLGSHPLLQPYGEIDSGVYARLAHRIAGGDLLLRGDAVPYFVSPLYAYFLAATGPSFPVARVVQILLGTAAVALVFLTARRLFGERAALAAGVLYALAGVVTFHEVLILQAAIDPFLTALFLYLLARAVRSEEEEEEREKISLKVKRGEARTGTRVRLGEIVAAGAAGGFLSLNRPNALLCVAAVAVALALFTFKENPLRRVWIASAFVAGAAVTIAPFTLRNLFVSREFVLVSSHGGLNFLVGNGPGADGVYRQLPGITPDIGGQAADTKRVAEAAEGRALTTGEVSSHFAREAFRWIRANPGSAASLFLRKIRFTLSGDEAPLNFSFPWYREKSLALKLLFVGPGLLVPLAGAGLVFGLLGAAGAASERRPALLVWATFIPAYVFAVAAFFVATRYRLPLLVALSPLAGAAVTQAGEAWRAKGARLAVAAAAATVLAIVSIWPTGLWDGAPDEEMHLVLWEIEKGEAGAMAHAESAAQAHPDPGLVWLRAGRSFAAAGKPEAAAAAFARSLASSTPKPEAAVALSALLEQRGLSRMKGGDVAGGRADFEEAVRLDAANAAARLNLAVACAMAGETDRARGLAREALVLKPDYEKAAAFLKALDGAK